MSNNIDAAISMAEMLNRAISLEIVTDDGTTYSFSKEQLDIARAALSEAKDAGDEIERLRAQLTDLRGGMAEARKGEDEQTERAFQAERRLASARKALELARKRIEYYGTIGPRRHFDHDMTEIFPKIDAALSLSDDTGNSK